MGASGQATRLNCALDALPLLEALGYPTPDRVKTSARIIRDWVQALVVQVADCTVAISDDRAGARDSARVSGIPDGALPSGGAAVRR